MTVIVEKIIYIEMFWFTSNSKKNLFSKANWLFPKLSKNVHQMFIILDQGWQFLCFFSFLHLLSESKIQWEWLDTHSSCFEEINKTVERVEILLVMGRKKKNKKKNQLKIFVV